MELPFKVQLGDFLVIRFSFCLKSKCTLLKVTYSKTVDNSRLITLSLHTGQTGWVNHYTAICYNYLMTHH